MEKIQKRAGRNEYIDVIRGLAMLMVVLGHTMTGCVKDSEQSFLFNIIWSLQMPLFILVSGYVTRYSRKAGTWRDLLEFIKRRTVSYILPWAVWTFLIRGLIFGKKHLLDIKYLLWNMDSGYWFLTAIWTISIIFGISQFFAEKLAKKKTGKVAIAAAVFAFGMAALLAVGLKAGISFFGIKLTLYYMPFYFAGYLYGEYQDSILGKGYGAKTVEAVVAVCSAVWITLLAKYNIYGLSDGAAGAVIIRAIASFAGCIAIFGLFYGLKDKIKLKNVKEFAVWCGIHSLEIYVVHYLILVPFKVSQSLSLMTIEGGTAVALNYFATILLSAVIIVLLNQNSVLRFLLFGKRTKALK